MFAEHHGPKRKQLSFVMSINFLVISVRLILYLFLLNNLILACSSASLSEIVVPIVRKLPNGDEQVLAVLDIDSEYEAHFDDVDRLYLEELVRESIEPSFPWERKKTRRWFVDSLNKKKLFLIKLINTIVWRNSCLFLFYVSRRISDERERESKEHRESALFSLRWHFFLPRS